MVRPDPDGQELAVSTIPALLARSAQRWGGRPALWRWTEGKFEAVSYAALVNAAAAIAEHLTASGVGPGQRVAIRISDRFTWSVAYLGVLWSGATAIPIDPLLMPAEIGGILSDAEARFVFSDENTMPGGDDPDRRLLWLNPQWLVFDNDAILSEPRLPTIAPEALASIIYTSGTTGTAKGVMLTHANITSDIDAIDRTGLCESDSVFLSVLPVHHAFECTVGLLYALSVGAQVAYARSLKSNEILADLRASRATIILGVPLLFEKMAATIQRRVREATPLRRRMFAVLCRLSRMARAAGWRRAGRWLLASVRRRGGLDSLRMVVSGGAALAVDVAEFFDTIGLPLLQGYGLSEASPVVTVNRPGDHKYDTVGPPLPGIRISLRDQAPDGTGEIAVRGPIVTQGYWRRPVETAAVLQDGWLLTGDLGIIDCDGHLHILGRSKNVIISAAGKNIYPEEIEALLDAQPEIAESVVYGKTRPGRIGETVAAIVVPDGEWLETVSADVRDDADLLRAALGEPVQRVCAQLAQYKRITEWKMRRAPFERTATRKIKRHLVVPDARVLVK